MQSSSHGLPTEPRNEPIAGGIPTDAKDGNAMEVEANPPTHGGTPSGRDCAAAQYAEPSLRAITNQVGTEGYKFQLAPGDKAVSSNFPWPRALKEAKHKVEDFWTYDGAQPTLGHTGSIATSRDQVLPMRKMTEQECVEYNRVGSKKGWMFEGKPQENYGFSGENKPTHTDDGWPELMRKHRWKPLPMDAHKQELAHRYMPKIDIENNARGIGVTGPGSGNGGMAGGYQEINQERLKALPIPDSRFNWTGTREFGTARWDDGAYGAGAGGFRSGYNSVYEYNPVMPTRRTRGISKVTQNAA